MTVLLAAAEGSHLAGDLSVVAVGVVCLIAMDTIWQSIKEHRAMESGSADNGEASGRPADRPGVPGRATGTEHRGDGAVTPVACGEQLGSADPLSIDAFKERRAGTATSPCPKWRASAQRAGRSLDRAASPRTHKDAS